MRSSNSEDGAVGDASRETVAVACLGDLGSLSFCFREPWLRMQDGDQAKRLGITLVLLDKWPWT